MSYFEYGADEIEYLKKKDKNLAEVIDRVGMIKRDVNEDLFNSLVETIISQQISTKAAITVKSRLKHSLPIISPEILLNVDESILRECGVSKRKVDYLKALSNQIISGELDLEQLKEKSDQEVIDELIKLPGIGVWSAEMFLLFSLKRKNILSFNDFIIQKGLRMVYHHRKITKQLYQKYKKRYKPYGSIASFYLWHVGNGNLEGYKDYAPKKSKK